MSPGRRKPGCPGYGPDESPVPTRAVRGFTLSELLVVMAIIGIVASLLIGFFISNLRKTQLRDGAVQLLSDMRQARSQAQRTSQDSSVTLDSTAVTAPSDRYTTVWSVGSGAPISTPRRLSPPIRVAPYIGGIQGRVLGYSAPSGEADSSGVMWEVSSTVISDKLYLKVVGVTGKVMLVASPN